MHIFFLRAEKPRHRRLIERAIESLAAHPFTQPSFIAFDSDGMDLFHHILARYAIVYHVDHAARRGQILEIRLNK